jgi:hypothetical protein
MNKMPYGNVTGIKDRMDIEVDDSQYDLKISRALAYADGMIQGWFQESDATVPAIVPDIVQESANDLAAYHMLRTKNPELAQTFYMQAKGAIDAHLRAVYGGGGAVKVTTNQVESEKPTETQS